MIKQTLIALGLAMLIPISAMAYSTDYTTASTQPCVSISDATKMIMDDRVACKGEDNVKTYFNICADSIVNGQALANNTVMNDTMCADNSAAATPEPTVEIPTYAETSSTETAPAPIKIDWTKTLGGLKRMFHLILIGLVIVAFVIWFQKSLVTIGPSQVGLINKKFSFRRLKGDSPIAFNGEAGYQAKLLMPGALQFVKWPFYTVTRYPWVQIPPGQIGIVVSQIGKQLDSGTRTAAYKSEFGSFADLAAFTNGGGQKGVQRKILLPGSILPVHPVAFVVVTKDKIYGKPLTEMHDRLDLDAKYFNLQVVPSSNEQGGTDVIGIVTALEGPALESGDIASRLDGFKDITQGEIDSKEDTDLIEMILSTKNHVHENYQDAQAFLDNGGKVGIQHDPLLPGSYGVNPFDFRISTVPMLIVEQGQGAVVKSYVGLPTQDTAGEAFKFGCLVKPGHRGVWETALGTGKYAINPHCYDYEIVPTSIITLEWSQVEGRAEELDKDLNSIVAKSIDGFRFAVDLHVQIHIPIDNAPRVISMVGSMQNLVNEVLQAAVGNHFRDKIQSLTATEFIQKRQEVQQDAFNHIAAKLKVYEVETLGVLIQDIVMPDEIVAVLKQRSVADQEKLTYDQQKLAQEARKESEKARGMADQQASLATSEVGMQTAANNAAAKKFQADGDSEYTRKTNAAEGLGKAEGYAKQVEALGATNTMIVNAIGSIKQGTAIVPEVFVGNGGNLLDGVLARLTKTVDVTDLKVGN